MKRKQEQHVEEPEETIQPTPGTLPGDMRYEHKTFGMINIGRISTTTTNLFGSSVKHGNTIRIVIQKAEYNRSTLGYDSYYGKDQLIDIEMSANQFANAITNMNSGGVPCTIRYIGGNYMGKVPNMETKKAQATNEFRKSNEKFVARFSSQIEEIQELIAKGRAGKGDLNKIGELLDFFKSELLRNQPFHMDQFIKGMDTIANEIKAEVESHIISSIHNKGINAINQEGGFQLGNAEPNGPVFEINE